MESFGLRVCFSSHRSASFTASEVKPFSSSIEPDPERMILKKCFVRYYKVIMTFSTSKGIFLGRPTEKNDSVNFTHCDQLRGYTRKVHMLGQHLKTISVVGIGSDGQNCTKPETKVLDVHRN